MPVIDVDCVTKVFKVTRRRPGMIGALKALAHPHQELKVALDGLSFAVEPGEIVGYIGINGAGKSTTIKILTGVLVPTGGLVRVLGRDPIRHRLANARDIGVIFGQRSQLQWDLPLIESFELVARLYETPRTRFRELLDELTATLDLAELLNVPIRQMSLGQKMRAELAATLIHEPRILYLDEPTIGLDLIVKERIREVIKQQNRERGTTVILTTHDLGDIEELAQRVMIIDRGRLIFDGPLDRIRERFGRYRTLTLLTPASPRMLDLPPGAEVVECGERSIVLRFDRTLASASQVTGAVMSQLEVCDFSLAEPSLSSVVREIYGGALREARA